MSGPDEALLVGLVSWLGAPLGGVERGRERGQRRAEVVGQWVGGHDQSFGAGSPGGLWASGRPEPAFQRDAHRRGDACRKDAGGVRLGVTQAFGDHRRESRFDAGGGIEERVMIRPV